MEKLNVSERKAVYVSPVLITVEVTVENGFGNSVVSFDEETYE